MINISYNVDLRGYTTFGIDARATALVEYDSPDDLTRLFAPEPPAESPIDDIAWMHIGAGSNMLFCGAYDGAVLHSRITSVAERFVDGNKVRLTVGSGVVFDDLIARCVEKGYWGIENLSHIPGEAGAAAVQNVGAYGVEFADVARRVRCYDTVGKRFVDFDVAECDYGYRYSRFKGSDKGRYIVVEVEIELSLDRDPVLTYAPLNKLVDPTVAEVREAVIAVRKTKLPEVSEAGSAGSFFKNPVVDLTVVEQIRQATGLEPSCHMVAGPDGREMAKVSAAWLIDKAGLKGSRCGGAGLWPTQPLVIVNEGGATAADVVALEQKIVRTVDGRFGITLEPEVEHVGCGI